jgi:predicted RNA-binding Zn-ribbon protein involved in translation (DUF1610 family)
MKPPWRVCPRCEAALDRKAVSLTESFDCPRCDEKLRVRQTGSKVRGLTVYLLSLLLTYEIGLRGLSLVIVSALALWPLGFAAKFLVNAAFPPRVVVRPNDDPDIRRCPKCGVELQDRLEMGKAFACPMCGESVKLEMGRGLRFLMIGVVLWLFIGTPLASLLGYELGIRGINLALLPLAVFLAGAAILGLVFRLLGNRIQRLQIKAAPPNPPPSILGRTELKLDNWKHKANSR